MVLLGAAAGAFLLLHLVVAVARPGCAWGIDPLVDHGTAARLAFAVAGAALLVPSARRGVIALLGRAPAALFAAAGVGVFVAGRSMVPLLGDGQLHLNDLDLAIAHGVSFRDVGWANEHAPLSFWTLHALHGVGRRFWTSPETTFRVLGVACGAIFLLLAIPVARRAGRTRVERGLFMGLLASAGTAQLFAGYAEIYALLMPVLLLWIGVALRELGSDRPPWISAAVTGVLLALHLATATLWPALGLLAATRAGEDGRLRLRGGSRAAASVGAAFGSAAAVAGALFAATGFDVAKLWGAPQGVGMLPLGGDLGALAAYPLLSGAHAFDVLNEILLVAPATLLALALGLRADGRAVAVFLATAAAGPVLFLCVANPEIGFFRDWDAFSFAAVPLLAWTAVSVAGRVTDQTVLAHAAILLVGAAALHTAAWLSVNADAARAEARFVRLLSSCTLSEHARAYGWESIGSRYKLTRRFDEALDAFERAIESSPDNPRHWNTAGELHLLAGTDDEARRHFERAVALNPELAEAWHGLGVARFRAGDDVGAIRAFEAAIARRPDAAPPWYNLGLCRQRLGMYQEAAAAFRRCLELEKSGPLAEDVRRRLAELEAAATRR